MTATTTFIIGPPRGGTTLLKDLLAVHPELTVHGEDFHPFHHDLTRFRDRTEPEDHFRLTAAEATVGLAREYGARIDRARQESGCEHFVLKISTLSIPKPVFLSRLVDFGVSATKLNAEEIAMEIGNA